MHSEPRPVSAAPRCAGFTLLELLLALGVSAMIAVLAYAALSTAIAAHTGMREEVRLISELQRSLDIIEADFSAVLTRRNHSLQGSSEAVFAGGDNYSPLLQFTRGGVANPAGLLRSDMQRLHYVLSGAALWRQHRWQLDGADPNQVPESTLLLQGVKALRLEFLPRQAGAATASGLAPLSLPDLLPWQEAWDSEHLRVGQAHPLPLAIRLSLDIEGLGSIQRIFGLP